MKRYLGAIALSIMAIAAPAQSVWTGNAAVGEAADFPGDSAVLRAASNSFPSGTELVVTNPRGGQSIEVTVTGRLETPGVFILIERSAAQAIELPTDHVLPVRVTPLKTGRALSPTAAALDSGPLSDDDDYNPAASLPEDIGEVRTAPAPASTTTPAADDAAVVEDAPLVVVAPVETPPKKPKIETSEPEGPKPETIVTYDLSESEEITEELTVSDTPPETKATEELTVSGTPPETEVTENLPEDDDRVVYFLTPSDLKPPPAVEETAPAPVPIPEEPKVDPGPAAEIPSASPVPQNVPTATSLPRVLADDVRPYIQIGAYRNQAVLEVTAARIRSEAPGYPLSYAVGSETGNGLFKLLIGPLRPAETGVVLENARSSIFPDAFPYAK